MRPSGYHYLKRMWLHNSSHKKNSHFLFWVFIVTCAISVLLVGMSVALAIAIIFLVFWIIRYAIDRYLQRRHQRQRASRFDNYGRRVDSSGYILPQKSKCTKRKISVEEALRYTEYCNESIRLEEEQKEYKRHFNLDE